MNVNIDKCGHEKLTIESVHNASMTRNDISKILKKENVFFFYQILRIYPQNVVKPTDLVKSFLAYSNQNNSATVWKLTAQANRKVISEITLPRLPGAEWLVIISISVAKLLVAIRY